MNGLKIFSMACVSLAQRFEFMGTYIRNLRLGKCLTMQHISIVQRSPYACSILVVYMTNYACT